MNIIVATPSDEINLGRVGENNVTQVRFNVSAYQAEYEDANFILVHQLTHAGVPYPVHDTLIEGGYLRWNVTSGDLTKAANGWCELIVKSGEAVKKSIIFRTRVYPALDDAGTPPEPWDSWQAEIVQMRDEAVAAAEGAAEYAQTAEVEAQNAIEAAQSAEGAAQAVQDMGVQAETLEAGADAAVEKAVDETTGAVTLKFGLPRGKAGEDGYSPVIAVADIPGGHRVTITDAAGDHVFDVMDGEGGGASDYDDLTHRPKINSVTLTGNKSLSELGIAAVGDIPAKVSELENDAGYITGYTETDPTVPAWAKAANKPSYTAAEVGALPEDTAIPTKVSELDNDAGYITGYTETDPTVPAWAKAASKPSYTAAEVGALPEDTEIPSPEVTVLTPVGNTHMLKPCPVTYSFGEKAELSVTVTADTQYHFMFSCPSSAATVLTMTGITGRAGDTLAAGKTYEVDIWAGVALIKEIEVTAV